MAALITSEVSRKAPSRNCFCNHWASKQAIVVGAKQCLGKLFLVHPAEALVFVTRVIIGVSKHMKRWLPVVPFCRARAEVPVAFPSNSEPHPTLPLDEPCFLITGVLQKRIAIAISGDFLAVSLCSMMASVPKSGIDFVFCKTPVISFTVVRADYGTICQPPGTVADTLGNQHLLRLAQAVAYGDQRQPGKPPFSDGNTGPLLLRASIIDYTSSNKRLSENDVWNGLLGITVAEIAGGSLRWAPWPGVFG